jgi:hypothetical protein
MKNSIKLVAVALVATCGVQQVKAQTNTDTSVNNFAQTAANWFSSIDYTKAWPTNEIDLSVGGLWRNNSQWGNYLNGQKNFGNIVTFAEMDNEGILNQIYRIGGGAGYRFLNRGDLTMQGTIGAGYDKLNRVGFVEPAVTLKKLMAHGAFSELSLNYPIQFKGRQADYPGLRIGTGFTF